MLPRAAALGLVRSDLIAGIDSLGRRVEEAMIARKR